MRVMTSPGWLRSTFVLAISGVVSLAAGCGKSGSTNNNDAGAQDSGADAAPALHLTWDWTGIIGTGQSLSVGAFGNESETTQPLNNLKLKLGALDTSTFDPTMADPASTELTLAPLTEPIRSAPGGYPSAYPRNIDGLTPHAAMAQQVTTLATNAAAPDYVTVHSVVGESGQPMTVIDKAATQVIVPCQGSSASGFSCSMGRAYASTLFEVNAISRLAAAAGKTLRRRRHHPHPRRIRRGQHGLRRRYLPALVRLQPGLERDHQADDEHPDAGVAAELGAQHRRAGVGLGRATGQGRARSPGRHHLRGAEVPVSVLDGRDQPGRPPRFARIRAAGREDGAGLLRARGRRAGLGSIAADQRRTDGHQRRARPLPRPGAAAGMGRLRSRRRTRRAGRSRPGRWDAVSRSPSAACAQPSPRSTSSAATRCRSPASRTSPAPTSPSLTP